MVVFTVRRRETLRTICLASIPLVLAARIACLWIVPPIYLVNELSYRITPLRADALLTGGLVALTLRGPEGKHLLRWAQPVFFCAMLALLLGELASRLLSPAHTFYHPFSGEPFMYTVGYTLVDLTAAALVLSLLSLEHPLARLLNLRPLRALGVISYGFYVFHDIFRDLYTRAAFRLPAPFHIFGLGTLTVLLAFTSTLALSLLSFHLFEKRFLKLKSHFAD